MNPPIPTRLRILRGNPQKRPIPQNEPQPEVSPKVPEPLPHLSELAQAEWRRAAPELHKLGLLADVDLTIFGMYCTAAALWRRADTALAAGDLLVPGSTGQSVANPLTAIAQKAAADAVKFGQLFGLTPSARVRIAAAGYHKPEPTKFGGLLA